MRLIDADKLPHKDLSDGKGLCMVVFSQDIAKAPTIDAEQKTGECKDCTHWDKLDYEAPRQGWCYQFEEFTDADEYCSRCAMMRGESHEHDK